MECMRVNCNLTALWQVRLQYTRSWAPQAEPVEVNTSLVVCGMCKELCKENDFDTFKVKVASFLGAPDKSYLYGALDFIDISNGMWVDPATGKVSPAPK